MDNVNKLNDQIIAIEANYHQSINAVLEEAKNKGIAFIENIKNETSNAIQNKVSENEQLFNSRCLEVKNTSDFIAKEFADVDGCMLTEQIRDMRCCPVTVTCDEFFLVCHN